MIKEITLNNIELEGIEKELSLQNISGKILKIFYKPVQDIGEINLTILTREGEELINTSEPGLYYPRANISAEKNLVGSIDVQGTDRFDYYYFNRFLLFRISSNNPLKKQVVINKIIIIYEE